MCCSIFVGRVGGDEQQSLRVSVLSVKPIHELVCMVMFISTPTYKQPGLQQKLALPVLIPVYDHSFT